VVIVLLTLVCWAQEILAPVDQSVVAPGTIRVIARAEGTAKLLLDGKPVPASSPAAGVWLAEVKAVEGAHELSLESGQGNATVRFFAGKEHNGWPAFKTHPPGNVACDTCHALKAGAWALRRATLSPLCHTCHDLAKFVPTHTHNTGTLVDCQNCHMPHGSGAKAHLRQPREVACKQCHN